MKKRIYPICLMVMFFLLTLSALSQTQGTTDGPARQIKPKKAKDFAARQMVVVKTGNEEFDEKVHQIMDDYWKLHDNIQYLTYDQLETALAENAEKYGVLTVNQVELTTYSDIKDQHNKYLRFSIWFGERMNKRRALYYQNVLYNDVSVKEITKSRVFSRNKNEYDFDLNETEVLFATGMIQNHLNARIAGKQRITVYYEAIENSGKLENKTLLIGENDLEEKLKGKDLSNFYPYPYKIVPAQEIEEKFLARDGDYAYVEIIPLGYAVGVNTLYVIDCENGELLSFGEQHNGVFDKFSNYVSKDHLKRFVKNSNRGKKKLNLF